MRAGRRAWQHLWREAPWALIGAVLACAAGEVGLLLFFPNLTRLQAWCFDLGLIAALGGFFFVRQQRVMQRKLAEAQAELAAVHLGAAEERYRELVENAGDLYFRVDVQGTVTAVNQAIVRFLGYERDEVVGQSIAKFIAPESLPFVHEKLGAMAIGDIIDSIYEVEILRRDGTSFAVEVNSHPLHEGDRLIGAEGFARDLAPRRMIERQKADRRFLALVRHASDVILIQDGRGVIDYASPSTLHLWGYAPERLIGSQIGAWLHADDAGELAVQLGALLLSPSAVASLEVRLRRQDGTWRHVEITSTNLCGDPDVCGIVLTCHDVTQRREAEGALCQREEQLRALVTNAPVILFSLDREGMFTAVAGREFAALDLDAEHLVGRSAFEYFAIDHPAIHHLGRALRGEMTRGTVELASSTFEYTFVPTRDEMGAPVGVIGVATNVTERRAFEQRLTHQALHDALTGLPNRAFFIERLGESLERAEATGGLCAVLFLDLDRFKVVNDSLGHEVGDRLLIGAGERLLGCLRTGDLLARLGGDEFVIVLDGPEVTTSALAVAKRIIAAFQRPFTIEQAGVGQDLYLSTSIGIAFGGQRGERAADLVRDADIAMYRAKHGGKDRFTVFDESMSLAASEQLVLEAELRRGIAGSEFVLHYQPTIELTSGRMIGVEALARWQHPERGLVSPEHFIPLAEETGMILPLGRWTIVEACRQLHAWQARHPGAELTMSVNLSPRQFQDPDLVAAIARTLAETGIHPTSLRLEITESMVMEETLVNSGKLAALRALGISLAIDDFGTGYSSLGYLKRLPVDMLKIDRSFVTRLGLDQGDTAIVRAVVTLAQTLGIAVTAEGVETAAQQEELRALGCEYGQGFFFSQPIPADEIDDLLLQAGQSRGAVLVAAD